MENISSEPVHPQCLANSIEQTIPFSQEWKTITKAEYIELTHQINYWKALHAQLKQKNEKLEDKILALNAKNKDLQNRLFGKKSEKKGSGQSEKSNSTSPTKKRGQQRGSKGHGRTPRPNLPVISQTHDLADEDKLCSHCNLPHIPTPALDECNDYIEVEVRAYTRRVSRPAYIRNPGCRCEKMPAIITAPPFATIDSPQSLSSQFLGRNIIE